MKTGLLPRLMKMGLLPRLMKILIVDDSRAMRLLVMRGLRQAGYGDHELIEATDGAAALRQVQQDAPDLIMCDWNMPEMTGIELLRALRASGVGVKFGFVTSEVTPIMRQTAMDSGALFFVSKPFSSQDIESALGPLLQG
jgi:two-component system chemotaxis response regulator CheY